MRRSLFTLLEVIIAMVLLASVGSLVIFNIHTRVEKKRFHSQMEQLQDRFMTIHRLAIAMQADWVGAFKKDKDGWVFETKCLEIGTKKTPALHFQAAQILLNGKNFDKLEIGFFSSGTILPSGSIAFLQKGEKFELLL